MVQPENNDRASKDLFAPAAAPRWAAGIIAVLVVGIAAAWFGGLLDSLANRLAPTLVETTGIVTMNGEPLHRGIVRTETEVVGQMGGLSEIQPDGTFKLATNGEPGIYAGNHRFVVSLMTERGFPPTSLIPEEYSWGKTTPFRFMVERGKANRFELVLKGELKVDNSVPNNPQKPSDSEPPQQTESDGKTE